VQRRGRFMGLTTFIGTGMGAIGAGLSAWLLATFPFPLNFAYTFLIAATGVTLSWVFLALTREPAQPPRGERQSRRQFWEKLRRILARDHNFRRFLVARILLALGAMGQGFITVAAVRRWDVPDSVVGGFTAALLLGQTTGTLVFGMLADRFGHKLSLELSGMATLALFALAWLAPSPAWYYAVFFLLGLYLGAIVVSGILVIMEFSAPERRPTYVGLANTGVGVAGVLAPLLAAGIAGISYDLLFAMSAALSLCSLILMRWWVREPRYL
ncbi:MAG: MFS transporter, partial [Acidobacteriota bacterium]